jgi:hypothetical protein
MHCKMIEHDSKGLESLQAAFKFEQNFDKLLAIIVQLIF